MTHVVSALFGAMLALLVYTRLGGMATTVGALGVLVVYLILEASRDLRDRHTYRRDRGVAVTRWEEWTR